MVINHDNYPDSYLKQILTEVKTIALVGASPRSERDSYLCMEALLREGYQVIPVNPREAGNKILGQRCYESLAAVEQPVDMVDIFRSSEAALEGTAEVMRASAATGRGARYSLPRATTTTACCCHSAGPRPRHRRRFFLAPTGSSARLFSTSPTFRPRHQ